MDKLTDSVCVSWNCARTSLDLHTTDAYFVTASNNVQ